MHKQKQQSAGFTLIEIIVVVAIIGTMVAVMGVRLNRDEDRLARLEAGRFHALLMEIRDEAVISGNNFALSITPERAVYSFEQWNNGWQPIQDDVLLKPRQVEHGVSLRWQILDQIEWPEPVVEDEESSEEQVDDDSQGNSLDEVVLKERVYMSSLGEISRFQVEFIGNDDIYRVFMDDDGKLAVERLPTGVF